MANGVTPRAMPLSTVRSPFEAVAASVVAASADQLNVSDPEFESPDLVVVESETADEGIGIAGMMRLAMPDVRLVLITPYCDLAAISRAFASGVDGYLTNSIACEAMVGALRLVSVPFQMSTVTVGLSAAFPNW